MIEILSICSFFLGKGFGRVTVMPPNYNITIDVFVTHMQAYYTDVFQYDDIRSSQAGCYYKKDAPFTTISFELNEMVKINLYHSARNLSWIY